MHEERITLLEKICFNEIAALTLIENVKRFDHFGDLHQLVVSALEGEVDVIKYELQQSFIEEFHAHPSEFVKFVNIVIHAKERGTRHSRVIWSYFPTLKAPRRKLQEC